MIIAPTPLQMFLGGFFDLLQRGRDQLGDDEYQALIWILTDRVGDEAARLLLGEALRATREDAA